MILFGEDLDMVMEAVQDACYEMEMAEAGSKYAERALDERLAKFMDLRNRLEAEVIRRDDDEITKVRTA